MKISLIENSNDSLSKALDYYLVYLSFNNKHTKEAGLTLKYSIIFLHNAMELFLKSILAKQNILLIVKDIDDKAVYDVISRKVLSKKNDVFESILKDEKIHTANYSCIVERYASIYKMNKKQVNTLNELGKLRNMIMHFGISKDKELYKVVVTVNDSFELINEILYIELRKFNKMFKANDFYDLMDDAFYLGRNYEHELWRKNYEDIFSEYLIWYKDLLNDKKFLDFIEENNLKFTYNVSDSFYQKLVINRKEDDEFIISFYSYFSIYHNSILLIESESPEVYIVLDYTNRKLFVYTQYKEYELYPEPHFQWLDDSSTPLCKKLPLDFSHFQNGIISTIKRFL